MIGMTPFGSDCNKRPKDEENLIELALGATKALKAVHGTSFAAGPVCKIIYQVSVGPGRRGGLIYSKSQFDTLTGSVQPQSHSHTHSFTHSPLLIFYIAGFGWITGLDICGCQYQIFICSRIA